MVDLHMHTVYSDGNKKTNIDLGVGKGSINIPKEIIDEWLN